MDMSEKLVYPRLFAAPAQAPAQILPLYQSLHLQGHHAEAQEALTLPRLWEP